MIFLETLISQLLNNIDLQKAIDFAYVVGALVAQSKEANPKITNTEIDSFINP